jgi:hypothetical protein
MVAVPDGCRDVVPEASAMMMSHAVRQYSDTQVAVRAPHDVWRNG